MDDDGASRLEEAISELGTLLVQLEKFQAHRASDAEALRAASLAIGDRARRAHRHGRLEPQLAADLLADAVAARSGLEARLASIRSSKWYTRAVRALAAADRAAVATAIVHVYAGAEIHVPPPTLYHPVAWQRRGRPRVAADIADEIASLRTTGLAGESDPAASGVDPALPAVVLHPAPPPGAPVVLVLRAAALPPWVVRLPVTDDVFVPGERFLTPFEVELLTPDDDAIDGWVLDPSAFRQDLYAALLARRLPVVSP
ncbi:MAG: hypothetical protein ACREQL_14475 [Candidatus Binatia bacterium]